MNEERQIKAWNNPLHKKAALEMAERSIVLLKNDNFNNNKLLPLSSNYKKIALIGELANAKQDMQGFWCVAPDSNAVTTLYEAMLQHYSNTSTQIIYDKGCLVTDTTHTGFTSAINAAKESDIVIVMVGEKWNMSGEAKSRANIHLPGIQEEMVKALHATGKPIIVLVAAGRPLIFNFIANNIPAILNTWLLGDFAGNAIMNVLTGKYNPSGKLPITFPKHMGQIPIFYAHKNTGRPSVNNNTHYTSAYIDMTNEPQYAFGHGLSYANFDYSDFNLTDSVLSNKKVIKATITITNTSNIAGEEVVQLYIRDRVASVTRPVKELKDFNKIYLLPQESKKVTFNITQETFKFYSDAQKKWITEPGNVEVMIGSASNDIRFVKKITLQ
jgi:beta-glucosidase